MNAARASFLALLLCWAFAAFADIAVPPLVGRVVDQTATLSSDDVASLNQLLRDFEARKGSQVAVLIVPTTNPESIEQYSIRVAEVWKIGRKKIDDGVVLVVAKNDRKLRIEVGYGLEGALTDVTAKRIIDEYITPRFRSGDFSGGISAGVNQILRVVTGEKLPAPEPAAQRGFDGSNFNGGFVPFIVMGLLFAGALFRAIFGRLIGASIVAGLAGLIVWFIVGIWFASLLAAIAGFIVTLLAEFGGSGGTSGYSSSGGSYSGGGGGWSGSSSSDSSSDSGGGGGSFGGGGASGSW